MKKQIASALAVLLCISSFSIPVNAQAGMWEKNVELDPGESTTIKLTGKSGRILYTVSDGKIFSYDPKTGILTAVSPGTATLTAEFEGKKYKCTVTVNGEPEEKTVKSTVNRIDGARNIKIRQDDTVTINIDTYGKSTYVRLANATVAQISCGITENGTFPLYITGRLPGESTVTVCEYGTDKVLYALNIKIYREMEDAEIFEDEIDDSQDYASQVIVLVNRERAARGLPALTYDDELTEAAEIRVKELKNKFSHTRPNGKSVKSLLSNSGLHIGENIARKYTTPQEVMKGWMASSRHRKNILSEGYTKIGVAYDPDSKCWIQVFSD